MNDHPQHGTGSAPMMQFNNPVIVGGTYNAFAAANDARPSLVYPLGSLESLVAFDALLNSEERLPAPHCHPDTRKAALQLIESWIWNRQTGFKGIMWVSGAPGVGKSAILQTICEKLAGSYNPIHASFFFNRGQGAREHAASLAPTLAYQFTYTSIICRWYIWYLLRSDPLILRQAFHSQFQKLITRPATARSYVQYPMVVVIDGLDECNNAQDRLSLLKLIFEAASTKSIRFLIASRPEEEIERFFKDADISKHVDHIVLDEESFKTSKDIIIFLRSEFARIRQSRPYSIPSPIDGEEWPGEGIISRLAVDSDGQFIFATLSIGYIDTEFFSPHEQLESLLNPPPDVTPFSKLDRLYYQILTRRPPHEQGEAKFAHYQMVVQGILQVVIAWPSQLSIANIATVLGEEVYVVQTIVRGPLRTLFKFDKSGPDSLVALCHKSLGDCLSDPHRSGEFHVPRNALDLLYLRILSHPPPSDPSRTFSRDQLITVVHVVIIWPQRHPSTASTRFMRPNDISLVSGVDFDAVCNIIQRGPTSQLFTITHQGKVEFSDFSLYEFLFDRNRAGEYCIPENALDLFCRRILSHPPPEDISRAFSQAQILAVLRSMVALQRRKTRLKISTTSIKREDVAIMSGVEFEDVCNIVQHGPTSQLFTITYQGQVKLSHNFFCSFLLDPDRSGDFYVPESAICDSLYINILSASPPSDPSRTFSRKQLIDFLYTIVAWPSYTFDVDSGVKGGSPLAKIGPLISAIGRGQAPITYSSSYAFDSYGTIHASMVALLIGAHIDTVWNIVRNQPTSLLFTRVGESAVINRRDEHLRSFLLDPHRAGEFHVPPNALDILYLGVFSRRPPPDCQRPLLELLHALMVFAEGEPDFLARKNPKGVYLKAGAAQAIVRCPQSVLFKKDGNWGKVYFIDPSLGSFLLDSSRSGKFCFEGSRIPDPSVLWPPGL